MWARTLFQCQGRRIRAVLGLGLILGSVSNAPTHGQTGARPPFRPGRPLPGGAGNPQDRDALRLLFRKLHPTADFAGEQITELRGGIISRQRIKGDRRGRLRVEYLSPDHLVGDVMIIAPDHFHNYHRRANTLDIAFWPTAWNEREKRMFAAIREGRVSAAKVGEEIIAGRSAAIVVLRGDAPLRRFGKGEAKFWIDLETGIQLKNEITNAGGLISRSTLTNIVVGPSAGVLPRDFRPDFPPQARLNPLFPVGQAPFRTVQEAIGRLPFTPVEPAALPPGFRLGGVWTFGPSFSRRARRGAILMRYTDGVTNFTLFERVALEAGFFNPRPKLPNRPTGNNSLQYWRASSAQDNLEIFYVGHLPPEQARAVRESLHPSAPNK